MRVRMSGAASGPAVGALKPNCMSSSLDCIGSGDTTRCRRSCQGRSSMSVVDGSVERLIGAPLAELMGEAAASRDAGHGNLVSYSRKVFIPLTKLCRDVCHYCTFAERPRAGHAAYLSPDE